MPIQITNIKLFEEHVKKPNLTVVHFSANWAEQCTQINDVLDELANHEEFIKNNVQLCFCEAEELAEKSLQYKIEAAPTLLFFRNGNVIDRIDGVDVGQLVAKISQHNCLPDVNSKPVMKIEDRLKQLVNKHNIMIFMKGDRNTPRCGFSKTLINIMNDSGMEYETFDILQDEEVRQELKVYSDWPTYPQLYVKGELIGGLDIIKELLNSGELIETLKG